MFIAALFMITGRWEQPRSSPAGEWTDLLQYHHTMGCHMVAGRNAVLTKATKWRKTQKQYVEGKQPVTKDHIFYVYF